MGIGLVYTLQLNGYGIGIQMNQLCKRMQLNYFMEFNSRGWVHLGIHPQLGGVISLWSYYQWDTKDRHAAHL